MSRVDPSSAHYDCMLAVCIEQSYMWWCAFIDTVCMIYMYVLCTCIRPMYIYTYIPLHTTQHLVCTTSTLCSHSLTHPHTSPQDLTHQCFTPSNHLTRTHPDTSPSLLTPHTTPSHITLTHPHTSPSLLTPSRISASLHLTISPLHTHTLQRNSLPPHTSLPTPHTSPSLLAPSLTMRESHILLCDVLQFVPAPPLDPGEGVSHPQHWVTPLCAKGNSIALYREGGEGEEGRGGSRGMMVIKRRLRI